MRSIYTLARNICPSIGLNEACAGNIVVYLRESLLVARSAQAVGVCHRRSVRSKALAFGVTLNIVATPDKVVETFVEYQSLFASVLLVDCVDLTGFERDSRNGVEHSSVFRIAN